MAEFTVRYWFGDDGSGQAVSYVSEGLTAESVDHATLLVQSRLDQPFFAVDSDGYGRVIINRDNVRFCSILPARDAAESAAAAQAGATADAHSDLMARAAAAVDANVRRF